MNKNTIIQELSAWHDAMLQAQARPFLDPLGLDMRFDAEAFDEDERQNSDCIALYRGGSVFEKVIRYWINYDAMADVFIREDDCSQTACKEQMHINLFYVIGAALLEMFSDLYHTDNKRFDELVDSLPDKQLRTLLQGRKNPKQVAALCEEFAASHQSGDERKNPLYRFCLQYQKHCIM
ncbi:MULTISPECIES: hypothetical protein [Alistipes]|uniref:hypothetical protein n=1 Tax=Alistipes TaxID=239759 RepID=UPI003FD8AB47